jgi:putative ABC transport system permease protein
MGASTREVGAFIWAEAGTVVIGAAILAAGLGWLLARMLVAMLTHVFDPPPDHLAVPWGLLGLLYAVAMVAGIAASALGQYAIGRLALGQVLRER